MIYIACPYSHKNQSVRVFRFAAACKVAAHFIKKGCYVYSPISHSHPIAELGELPLNFSYWADLDLYMLQYCTEMVIVIVEGWETSIGIQAEKEKACELGVTISYFKFPEDLESRTELDCQDICMEMQEWCNKNIKGKRSFWPGWIQKTDIGLARRCISCKNGKMCTAQRVMLEWKTCIGLSD